MATHSRILAWKIPWTEEPCGLQSMGSQSWTQLKHLSTYACRVLHGSFSICYDEQQHSRERLRGQPGPHYKDFE